MALSPKGRPSKLTPELQERICQLLKAGNTFRTACEVAGIGYTTGKEWRQRGDDQHPSREGDDDFAAFAAAIRKAEEEAVVRNVALIQKAAANGTWTAAAWWLERKFPAEWAKVDRHEHTGPGGKALQLGQGMSTEQIKARILELAAELGYTPPSHIEPCEAIEVEAQALDPG
jgi:hypothetical protein